MPREVLRDGVVKSQYNSPYIKEEIKAENTGFESPNPTEKFLNSAKDLYLYGTVVGAVDLVQSIYQVFQPPSSACYQSAERPVPAFLDATGLPDRSCGREGGFKIEVLDNNIWDPPLDRQWTPPNGSGKFWDKWTKEAGNSWTKAMEKFYTGAGLVLPNGDKVAAASNEVLQPAVVPAAASSAPAGNEQVAPAAVSSDNGQSSSAGSTTAETSETCAAGGLWSCSADNKWLMVCDQSATGLSESLSCTTMPDQADRWQGGNRILYAGYPARSLLMARPC
jgi:hypothetical protein